MDKALGDKIPEFNRKKVAGTGDVGLSGASLGFGDHRTARGADHDARRRCCGRDLVVGPLHADREHRNDRDQGGERAADEPAGPPAAAVARVSRGRCAYNDRFGRRLIGW